MQEPNLVFYESFTGDRMAVRKDKPGWFLWLVFVLAACSSAKAGDGYRLWLKYDKIGDKEYLSACRQAIQGLDAAGRSATIRVAREELQNGLSGLLGTPLALMHEGRITAGKVVIGTPGVIPALKKRKWQRRLAGLAPGGYLIHTVNTDDGPGILIAAREDLGVLYGVYHFLRLVQTHRGLEHLRISSSPALQWRMLNHWDNLDGSVERGYAGKSIWKWDELPGKTPPRYTDYARANASVGINAVVLNNVNSNPRILDNEYLVKVAALADIFRPYGIRVFLSANFASPKSLGRLDTADPLNRDVVQWWKDKADEIYKLIPDFGGFLIKANSEGQPGPLDYHRSHAEGANMMADILKPHGGILIWRAFVYNVHKERDRAKMAYDEFIRFDGKFHDNVFLQIKNGPLDFQPREPFSPLFGAMPHTNEMMEFQITQEYLGHDKALVYLAPLFKEVLESDTYARGKGSTVARILDGSRQGQPMTGMAGVANIGDDANWTGYSLAQANWYAFGRLAWDPDLSAEEIAGEWIGMTLTHHEAAAKTILGILMDSREIYVSYTTPLGLNVLCDGAHYGPAPAARTYFTRVDSSGLGYDRTAAGSNGVAQYFPGARKAFSKIQTCPEKYLCWFHHVPWDYPMRSGKAFREELHDKYNQGVLGVSAMKKQWTTLQGVIGETVFNSTLELLTVQEEAAAVWRDTCLKYFGSFSGFPPEAAF